MNSRTNSPFSLALTLMLMMVPIVEARVSATVDSTTTSSDSTFANISRATGLRQKVLHDELDRRILVTGSSGESSTGSFSFSAGGDLGASTATTANLDTLTGSQSDFFLALGDLSYNSTTPETAWCDYVISHVGPSLPIELVSGNHEDGGEEHNGLIDNFASCLPDRMGSTGTYAKEYYFDYPPTGPLARIIAISPDLTFTNGGYYSYAAGSPHLAWTENAINGARAAGIPWVIVAMHKVCISEGAKPCQIGPDLMNFLIAKRVDLVLQAHDHDYQRSKQLKCAAVGVFNASCVSDDGSDNVYLKGSGTIFVVAGIFGQPLYIVSSSDSEAPYFAKAFGSGSPGEGHGFMRYTVSPDRIDAKLVMTSGGQFEDNFSITGMNDRPIVKSVSISPSRPWAGTTVSFNATVQGGTPPYTATWDLNADGIPDAYGNPASWAFKEAGNVTISVLAIDHNGTAGPTMRFALALPPWSPTAFEFDWSDFNNNGRVDIWDVAAAIPCYNVDRSSPSWASCAYWDLDADGNIDITELAAIGFQYGNSMASPFPGQGQALALIDPEWHGYCLVLDSVDQQYCSSHG